MVWYVTEEPKYYLQLIMKWSDFKIIRDLIVYLKHQFDVKSNNILILYILKPILCVSISEVQIVFEIV